MSKELKSSVNEDNLDFLWEKFQSNDAIWKIVRQYTNTLCTKTPWLYSLDKFHGAFLNTWPMKSMYIYRNIFNVMKRKKLQPSISIFRFPDRIFHSHGIFIVRLRSQENGFYLFGVGIVGSHILLLLALSDFITHAFLLNNLADTRTFRFLVFHYRLSTRMWLVCSMKVLRGFFYKTWTKMVATISYAF